MCLTIFVELVLKSIRGWVVVVNPLREHQPKTFATLCRFWLLRGLEGLSESLNKGETVTKIFISNKVE